MQYMQELMGKVIMLYGKIYINVANKNRQAKSCLSVKYLCDKTIVPILKQHSSRHHKSPDYCGQLDVKYTL